MFNLPMGGSFKQQYRAFSVSMMPGQERHDVEKGGKSKKRRQKCNVPILCSSHHATFGSGSTEYAAIDDLIDLLIDADAFDVARLNIVYPMLFRLTNEPVGRTTHCGVLEFVAEEGRLYLPNWVKKRMSWDFCRIDRFPRR